MDLDTSSLSETSKAAWLGIPFLANSIKEVETPVVTKVVQGVFIAFLGAGAVALGNVAMSPISLSDDIRSIKQTLESDAKVRKLELDAVKAQVTKNFNEIVNTKADLKVVRNQVQIGTNKRVYRDEWSEANREQNNRLLHLERAVR